MQGLLGKRVLPVECVRYALCAFLWVHQFSCSIICSLKEAHLFPFIFPPLQQLQNFFCHFLCLLLFRLAFLLLLFFYNMNPYIFPFPLHSYGFPQVLVAFLPTQACVLFPPFIKSIMNCSPSLLCHAPCMFVPFSFVNDCLCAYLLVMSLFPGK